MAGGWQSFSANLVRTVKPHGLERPIVMDGTAAQHDGFRFVYCLPFSANEVFVEDTDYADGPEVDAALLRSRINEYCVAAGWQVAEVLNEEKRGLASGGRGDLGGLPRGPRTGQTSALAGVRAGLLHPLTGYSFPSALAFALDLADKPHVGQRACGLEQGTGCTASAQRQFLPHADEDAVRRDDALIRGYHAPQNIDRPGLRLDRTILRRRISLSDRLLILSGKPPVPFLFRVAATVLRVGLRSNALTLPDRSA